MPTIFQTSDLHIKLRSDRRYRKDLITCLKWLADTVIDIKPDFFVIAGDIFDTKSPTATESAIFTSFIKKILSANIDSIIVTGNHDTPNQMEEANALKPFFNFGIDKLHILHKPGLYNINGVDFLALPYVYHNRDFILSEIKKMHDEYQGQNLYFIGHFFLKEYVSSYEPANNEFIISSDFLRQLNKCSLFMLGHIHNMGDAGNKIYYSGSLFRTTLGETESVKGAILHSNSGVPTILQSPALPIKEINITRTEDLDINIVDIKDSVVILRIKNISADFIGKINDLKKKLELQHNYVDLDLDLTTVKFNSVANNNPKTTDEFFNNYFKMNNIVADRVIVGNIINDILSGNINDKTDFSSIKHLKL